jgi:dTDP-4-amino-4,6-dideoxygalactose transaminase
MTISYEGWDREYQENKVHYLEIFDKFMSQLNYENSEFLENRIAKLIGRVHAVGVANATDALHFALLSYGIGKGDEVLVTDFSWISSASCVSMVGATPVFCDININTYHIDIDSIKRMWSEKTKAIIYPHLFGSMNDSSEIEAFCKEKNVVFIEDAAQSLGSSLDNTNAGTIGDCSVYSFNSNKVVSGINGGGMFMTNDKNQADLVRKLRQHGKGTDFEMLGYNSRLYTLNSEIINFRLKNLMQNQFKRQAIAKKYNSAFSQLPVYFQELSQRLNHNYHKYTIRFQNKETRKRVKDALQASIHYEKPLSENSIFDINEYRKDECVNSKIVSDTILSLPIHAWLTNEEINSVINIVRDNI